MKSTMTHFEDFCEEYEEELMNYAGLTSHVRERVIDGELVQGMAIDDDGEEQIFSTTIIDVKR